MNSRRKFLTKLGLGTSSLLLYPFTDSIAANPIFAASAKVPVLDTHIHCFAGLNDSRFPYHKDAPYKPEASATPEHLLSCMNGAGVDFAVIVHPEPYQDDHRYLEHCLDVGKGRLKGTVLFFADRPDSLKQLPRLAKRGDIVAARVHAYLPDRQPPFGKPELRQLWKLAADNGLALQLHFEPRYAPGFEPLIKEFKDTKVVIDHLGRPFQARSSQEYNIVNRWAEYSNIYIKYSNLGETKTKDVTPYLTQIFKAYGADRIIWGGGVAAQDTPKIYRNNIAYARSLLSQLSQKEQDNIMGGNAATLYNFKIS